MPPLHVLPLWNATLNGTAGLFLVAGWVMIRLKHVDAHRACMAAAFACSTLFLAGYLYYHARVGNVHYVGAWPRVYFPILISHTILAVLVVPMVFRTFFLALKGRFEEHRRAARWTLPVWLYVSVTGVIVFEMLYRL